MGTLWDNIEKLSAVCRAAGAHLPDEELKALQVGKVAEEAGEAMHALHGLKGLTTCGDEHTWSEVQNDLVGAVIAALLAMHYIDPTGARATFDEILHRRTRSRCSGLTVSGRGRRPPRLDAGGGHVRHTVAAGLLPAR
ncbi:MazG-like family protein [Streptomyces sp. WL006]|uniref:MazG-like family protein n=1 Tax=Streptomyces sp. WL006 TaxID=3423915 RepID=UPI003F6B8795